MNGRAVRLAASAILGALVVPGLSACADRDAPDGAAGAQPPLSVEMLPTPAGPGSAEPNLAVGPEGFYLSWLEPTGEGRHALRFATWRGAGEWSTLRTVIDRAGLFVNWADFPSLAVLDDGTLAAHWLEKSGAGTYAYDVRMAVSRDGGDTWGQDVIPHRDGVQAEHGFVSLFPLGDEVGVVWLDGRGMVEDKPMNLRFTTVAPDGTLSDDVLLDDSTCECCQTGAAVAASGPVVVYRDRADGELRDIYLTRRVAGRWTPPKPVHDDGWVVPFCPVNGPSIDAAGERLAVAWFTASEDAKTAAAEAARTGDRQAMRRVGEQGRVLLAFSDDAGATFSAPVRVDDGQAMGRVDVVLLEDGSALVAWLERTADGAEVRLRQVGPEGTGASMAIAGTAPERASGFPRMIRRGDTVLFAWTEAGDTPVVRTAVGRLDAGGGRVIGSRGVR